MTSVPDRIEKSIVLSAPLDRVWHAIGDATQFGSWFGVDFDGPFLEGTPLTGRIVPTQVDAEVAKTQEPYRGTAFESSSTASSPCGAFRFVGIPSPWSPPRPTTPGSRAP